MKLWFADWFQALNEFVCSLLNHPHGCVLTKHRLYYWAVDTLHPLGEKSFVPYCYCDEDVPPPTFTTTTTAGSGSFTWVAYNGKAKPNAG